MSKFNLNQLDSSKNFKDNYNKSLNFKESPNNSIINSNISPINSSIRNNINLKDPQSANTSDLNLLKQLNLKSFTNKFNNNNPPKNNTLSQSEITEINNYNKFTQNQKEIEINSKINKINLNEKENLPNKYTNFYYNQTSPLKNMQKDNIYNLNGNLQNNFSLKKNNLNSPNDNEHLIINNLENELKEKNNEIKILKKNFKEKIFLVETENKKTISNLEDQFNNIVENINKNSSENFSGLEISNVQMKNEYDDIITKLQLNINNLKNNSVVISKHNNIIEELKINSVNKIEDTKNIYLDKLKELINYFDKPDYRKLIENLNFYMKFKEKLDFSPEDSELLKNLNFSEQEYEIWMDKIKLNLITAECDYINGVIELENNYLDLYEKIKSTQDNKYEIMEKEISDKFDVKFFFKSFFLFQKNFISLK